jgi:hypothetical protein
MKVTSIEGPVISLTENVLGALNGTEGQLVQFASGTDKIELAAAGGTAIGVVEGRLQDGSAGVAVRLLNAGGIVRMKQSAAIVPGARVRVAASGLIQTLAGTGNFPVVGVKIGTANGAANDIVQVLVIASAVPPVAQSAVTNIGSAGILALSVGASYVQAEVQALRAQLAAVSLDLAAMRTVLATAGLTTT